MRFSALLVSGIVAVASAQSTTASASAAQSSVAACLKACALGDVNCQSHCITVPSPNDQQVNDTNKCVAACPKGNGSQAETDKYASCLNGCIEKYYYASSEGTPQATGGSGGSGNSGSSSGSGAQPTGTAGGSGSSTDTTAAPGASETSGSGSAASGSGTGTKTGTAAAATSSGAAAGVAVGSSGAIFGAIAAILAL